MSSYVSDSIDANVKGVISTDNRNKTNDRTKKISYTQIFPRDYELSSIWLTSGNLMISNYRSN